MSTQNRLRILASLTLVFVLLSLAAASTHAAPPPISDDLPAAASGMSTEIVISQRSSEEFSPAIAYNSRRNQYLVVWENVWPGGHHDIYAQRLTGDGKLLSWFAVSMNSNKQMNPSVAYDPVNDRYFVVWLYDVWGDGSDWDVYGRFIPWNGPAVGLNDFAICNWSSDQAHPNVVYARAQEEFLVVWVNAAAAVPRYISGRRVFADGSGFAPGDGFTISSGPEQRDFPDVAYNLARNEYLVVWDMEGSGSELDIWGVRLDGLGNKLAGGEFGIAGWPAEEERPSVAACRQADQYLVAWQSDQDTEGADYAIYARYLNGAAQPGNVYLVDDTTSPEVEVDVSCNDAGRHYVLAWQTRYTNLKYGIWARFAFPSESMRPAFGVVAPGPAQNREYPAVAGGGSSSLVAWEHQRAGDNNRDIHGRLLRFAAYLPLMRR